MPLYEVDGLPLESGRMQRLISVADREGDVDAWLASPGRGEIVKENRVRAVYRWNGLFIKRFKHPGLVQGLRGRLHDRARAEHDLLATLRGRGLEVPEPVAWARLGRETFVFTREIPGARPLRDVPLTRPLLRDFARLVRRVHDAGLRHDDLHVGNVLLADGKLWLIDLHRAGLFRSLTPAERLQSLAFVILSFYTLVAETDVLRFLRAYGDVDPAAVWPEFQAARERYWLDRQARCRQSGSDFEKLDGLILRRPYAEADARRVFAAAPLKTIKELPGRRLWLADAKTFVKEGASRLWHNGFAVETRGIPTPRLLAVEGKRVAGEWIEGALPLWEHLKAQGVSRELLASLARLVRRLHGRGVFHRDLKANNVLVRGAELWVIDLDRVEFQRELEREQRVWNLAQLNAAVGAPATKADRLRFFFAYAGRDPELRRGWKSWVREIMKRTVERKHHWPGRETRT